MVKLTHGSLFSGIGGFDLASKWAGIETKWQVEIDDFCQKVLEKNFPNVKRFLDIKDCGRHNLEKVNIISGGFPCQPFSQAGKRRGKEDDRYLWDEMFRIIQELKPNWVIGENVAGFINMALDETISDLESNGYEVQAFVIPACAIELPHRRDRIWFIAHPDSFRRKKNDIIKKFYHKTLSNSIQKEKQFFGDIGRINDYELPKTAESRICGGNDDFSKRVDRLKSLGNAIVPQIAYIFFEIVKFIEQELV